MPTTAAVWRPDMGGGDVPDISDWRHLQEEAGDTISGNVDTVITTAAGAARADKTFRPGASHAVIGIDTAYGWAINLDGADGMEATSTATPGAAGTFKRRIIAGTWTFRGRIAPNATNTNPFHMRVRVYKYNADTTRTQQGSEGSQTYNAAILLVAGNDFDISITDVPEILLNDGETIVIVYYGSIQGNAVGALNVDFRVNSGIAGADTTVTLPGGGVRSRFYRDNAAVMRGVATQKKLIRHAPNTHRAVMKGVATMDRRLALKRAFTTVMLGRATMQKLKRFATTSFGSARLAGVATIRWRKNFHPDNFGSARMAGVASMKKLIRFAPNTHRAVMRGVATFSRRLALKREFAARMVGVPSFVRVFRGRRTFLAVMKGRATAFIKMAFHNVPTSGGGGGTTIIKKIFNIFDD